jgi:integrase/recombinase XerD
MANPRLVRYPALNIRTDTYRVTPDQIHDYEYQLRSAIQRLEGDDAIRPQDKKLISSFLKHLKAKEISLGRQAKYVNHLRTIAHNMSVPFRGAKRRDIEELITRLADHEIAVAKKDGTEPKRRYSPETMADFKMIVKVFMKFVRYGDTDKDTPYPDEVRWLRKTIKKSDEREKPYFTDQEAIDMVKAAKSVMKKAFIALRAEVGPRPGEGLLLRVGDLQFDDAGALLHIRRGKTGSRTVRLISSAPYLADYLSMHPYRTDPQAPLWLTTSTNHLNEPLSWVAANRIVKEVAAEAGIKKPRATLYMFRHGSATRNAKYLTDSELKLLYGWSGGSRMPAVYVHLSGGDLDEKIQSVYSGKHVEPSKPNFAPTICPRCQEKASPGMLYCPRCATPLDQAERAKIAVQEENTKKEVSELRGLLEKYLKASNDTGSTTEVSRDV